MSKVSKLSRDKGKVFERKIARILRERFPQHAADVRRSDQGHGAADSDVTGLPWIWVECQDAREPTPVAKLEQAEADLGAATGDAAAKIPIAITHKLRSRSMQVMLRLSSLDRIASVAVGETPASLEVADVGFTPVTLELGDFLDLLAEAVRVGDEGWFRA